MADLTGRNLGPYRLLEQLGAGGMATVFKAYHAAMDRYVAIKVLPEHLARDTTFRARFQREARTIARLEHRYILPVYDVAEDDGIPYLVMRLTDGGDMAGLIANGALSLDRAAELVAQVAEALAYAHRQGVIHRDVKPANVLISRDGDALLSDFGIAKIYAETLQLTNEGFMIGTPIYMAPEQLQGKAVDARTDIYSLGVVLYQALTGESPFVAETPLAVAMMHIHNPLRPPRQLNPAIPESIERVVLRALAKNPDDRFQAAGEVAVALREALAAHYSAAPVMPEPPPIAPPTPAAEPVPAVDSVPEAAPDVGASQRPRARKLWPIVGGVAAALVLVIAALAFSLTRGPAGSQAAGPTRGAAAGPTGGAAATSVPPDDVRQALETALRQLDAGDGGGALETLKPALVAHPDDPNLLAARGIANAIYTGQDEARADIERALSLAPNNGLAYYARGYLNARTDKADEAIADYTRAIELAPTFARAYYQRSRVLSYPKEDYAGERRDLDRAIELDPDLIDARMARASTLYYSSKLEAALPDLNHVLGLDPKHTDALHLRALLYAGQKRAADARRDFDAAAAAAPEDKDIFRDRAEFFVRQGDYVAALADADRLVALDGADPQWHGLRGFVLHALGRDDQALAAFDKALLIAGKEAWAVRYGHGLALLGLGRAQEALDDLLAAQAHPDDVGGAAELFYGTHAMPSVDLARAYQALGQDDKALQALDAALKQDESFVAYLERGRARAAAGDREGARADLQEALRRALEAKDDKQRALVEAELKKIQ
ncbi:MAG TPA: protein kinase [Roseiflexaceae bacterium]|nr:protein kinase [Roseiflexaceae bacterium]